MFFTVAVYIHSLYLLCSSGSVASRQTTASRMARLRAVLSRRASSGLEQPLASTPEASGSAEHAGTAGSQELQAVTSRQLHETPSLSNEVPVTTSRQLLEVPSPPKGGAGSADTQVQ